MADITKRLFHFRLPSLLFGMTVAAVWLSTLTGYTGSNDIQAFIWTAIVVTSGIAAASLKGRQRAYWAGFCSTMLLATMRTVFSLYGAKLSWTIEASKQLARAWRDPANVTGQQVLNMNNTLIFLTILVGASVIGFLSVVVYDQCTKEVGDG